MINARPNPHNSIPQRMIVAAVITRNAVHPSPSSRLANGALMATLAISARTVLTALDGGGAKGAVIRSNSSNESADGGPGRFRTWGFPRAAEVDPPIPLLLSVVNPVTIINPLENNSH